MSYLGQKNNLVETEQTLVQVHKEWSGIGWVDAAGNRRKQIPSSLADKLILLAHGGSWLAGNMLHLSDTDWDKLVGDEEFAYCEATKSTTMPDGSLFMGDKKPWLTEILLAEAGVDDPRNQEPRRFRVAHAEVGRPDQSDY